MSKFEIITISIAVGSLIIAIISIIFAVKSYKDGKLNAKNSLDKSEVQNLISLGTLEMSVGERISSTRNRVTDIHIMMQTNKDVETNEAFRLAINEALENNLNAFEDACSNYIDKKIDVDRFKKRYIVDIRQLVENNSLASYFNPSTTSRYKAILKVYDEWNNLEK